MPYDAWHGAYRGKLPPGAQEQIDRNLASWREDGLVPFVQISAPPDCSVGLAAESVMHPIDRPPELPLAGCERLPCCGCGLNPLLSDETGDAARPVMPRIADSRDQG